MAKQSPLGTNIQPDSAHSPAAAAAYAVGYRRAPVHTKWKRGQSGNPAGRRKGQRNVRTVLDEQLNERIWIREGNRRRSVTKLEAVIATMINAALKGSAKAQASLIALLRSVGMTDEVTAATNGKPFTVDDAALIQNYFARHGAELKRTQAPDDNEEPAPGEAPPLKKGSRS
jgi:Family of unknown function (DUF5681)